MLGSKLFDIPSYNVGRNFLFGSYQNYMLFGWVLRETIQFLLSLLSHSCIFFFSDVDVFLLFWN